MLEHKPANESILGLMFNVSCGGRVGLCRHEIAALNEVRSIKN